MQNFSNVNFQQDIQTQPITAVPEKTALALYQAALRVRMIEEALLAEYHPADEIRCPVHFCLGQEAVSAALSLLVKDEDYMFSHHRSHGYYLGKRAPLKALFAELYGRETGANGGKAGSQDISYSEMHFYSGAILSGATAISAGAALAFQNKKLGHVSVAGFGEGATDEGIFWETVNFAALRLLPLLLICENNYYATYSPMSKRVAVENISEKVGTFGMKTFTVFGNDPINVYLTLSDALEYIRSGKGPAFIEVFTYRYNSHVGPEDDGHIGYRSTEEMAFWKQHDPIKLLEEKLVGGSKFNNKLKEEIVSEIQAEISDAFKFAKESNWPEISDWTAVNSHAQTPLADALLREFTSAEFDQNQMDHIPGPY
jgi:TPP-dependent pyruvate/acetoin dehydrogenase alpha subunit